MEERKRDGKRGQSCRGRVESCSERGVWLGRGTPRKEGAMPPILARISSWHPLRTSRPLSFVLRYCVATAYRSGPAPCHVFPQMPQSICKTLHPVCLTPGATGCGVFNAAHYVHLHSTHRDCPPCPSPAATSFKGVPPMLLDYLRLPISEVSRTPLQA